MIDTHCHLTYDDLYSQLPDVLERARVRGVDRMVTVGTDASDAKKAQRVSSQYSHVKFTAGLHPLHVTGTEDWDLILPQFEVLWSDPNCVAIGEMGLDQHYSEPALELQQHALSVQLEAAKRSELPLVIHNRKATHEVLDALSATGIEGSRCVFHCFTGTQSEADAILEFGASLGLTGVVTFKNAQDLAEVATKIPKERLLLETDSPYLTPAPHRKVRPNEPAYVVDVAEFVASKRCVPVEALVAQCDSNACRIFSL